MPSDKERTLPIKNAADERDQGDVKSVMNDSRQEFLIFAVVVKSVTRY